MEEEEGFKCHSMATMPFPEVVSLVKGSKQGGGARSQFQVS